MRGILQTWYVDRHSGPTGVSACHRTLEHLRVSNRSFSFTVSSPLPIILSELAAHGICNFVSAEIRGQST